MTLFDSLFPVPISTVGTLRVLITDLSYQHSYSFVSEVFIFGADFHLLRILFYAGSFSCNALGIYSTATPCLVSAT